MERLIQSQDGKEISWPYLKNAEDLAPINPQQYKVLELYEERRLANLTPPTLRQIGDRIERKAPSQAFGIVHSLIASGYLKEEKNDEKRKRNITLDVNFETIIKP